MPETVAQHLILHLQAAGQDYVHGDQAPPCAVLWADPERLWSGAMDDIRKELPELYTFGDYAPEKRTGPALWLRCIEARSVDGAPGPQVVPIFYLPGISQEYLRGVEDCSKDLAPLVELQFRGILWLHPNGREWSPNGFLVSKHGGLGLEVGRDQKTQEALQRALPKLLDERVEDLRRRTLDEIFFNDLLSPDAAGRILRWLNEPEGAGRPKDEAEWKAFRQQCRADYGFDPERDGALRGAQLLAQRQGNWETVWHRFREAPKRYLGVVDWLNRAAPAPDLFYDAGEAEVWSSLNEKEESDLKASLTEIADLGSEKVAKRVAELESKHGPRRGLVWAELGQSPFAGLLGPLSRLAKLVEHTPGATDAASLAEQYFTDGWRVDAALLETLELCRGSAEGTAVLNAVRALYLPWLDATSRSLQKLLLPSGGPPPRRHPAPEKHPGRVVLFADGLRLDVAHRLRTHLEERNLASTLSWDWSTVPSVTATAKPHCSALAESLGQGESSSEFAASFPDGKRLTADRFVRALKEEGWQVLKAEETGDPGGFAWTECGSLDKRGHSEGWKLAHHVAGEVSDIATRIEGLLAAGWRELIVVTDHGWMLMPLGLPKVELKSFLAEHRWGRCAALNGNAHPAGVDEYQWRWNEDVRIVSPPGAGCYLAGTEYSHGGVSLQEMVTPRLTVGLATTTTGTVTARIEDVSWTNAKCRVKVSGPGSVDIRSQMANPASSFIVGKEPKKAAEAGEVSVFLEDDSLIGSAGVVVLLDAAGQVVHSVPTILGG